MQTRLAFGTHDKVVCKEDSLIHLVIRSICRGVRPQVSSEAHNKCCARTRAHTDAHARAAHAERDVGGESSSWEWTLQHTYQELHSKERFQGTRWNVHQQASSTLFYSLIPRPQSVHVANPLLKSFECHEIPHHPREERYSEGCSARKPIE